MYSFKHIRLDVVTDVELETINRVAFVQRLLSIEQKIKDQGLADKIRLKLKHIVISR